MRKIDLLTLLLLLLGGLSASAQTTITWTGATSTDWADASNWSPAAVPTADDDVVIPDVTNDPVIGASTAALAHSVEVQTDGALTIQNTGSLTINGSKYIESSTSAFSNRGTVNNNGQLIIGNLASVGHYGLLNLATFNNNTGGEIHIDNATSIGLHNNFGGTFTNAASIVIGATASVGSNGLTNLATFNNNTGGEIHIDRSSNLGLENGSGTFTNAASIVIGANASVGSKGLLNNVTFNNNTGGEIHIDNATSIGLHNNRGTFTNAARVVIGANASVGDNGLLNDRTFNNNTGGDINIDRSNFAGLSNEIGVFTNAASIVIGANASVGTYGLINSLWPYEQATFNNTGCGALLKVSSNAIITDVNLGILTNTGNIIENATGNSNITNNSGLVQNLNGGTFTITNNTGVNTTTAGTLWTGCTSTNWATASNWSSVAVPTADDNVVIPDVTNDPVIGATTAALAHSVEVQTNGALTIQNTGSLTINGSKSFGVLGTTAFYNQGTINNSGQLIIGNLASVGDYGLFNLATFNNNTGGDIHIDNSTEFGLYNHNYGTFTNAATIVIGATASVGTYGLVNNTTFKNNTGGEIHIDRSTLYGLLNDFGGTFTNAASIVIGANASVGANGLVNNAIFNNGSCASLSLFAVLYNGSTFTNQGLFTVNTTGAHSNTGFTNDGVIAYPQGNPIPNVTNNDVIILPAGTCATPILQIGGSNSFTIGTTWYKDVALSQAAGTYNASTNSFASSGLITGTVYPLYFRVTNGSCTQTTSVTATAQTCATCGNATNLATAYNSSAGLTTFSWSAAVNPIQWQVQYKSTAPGAKWIDVRNVQPTDRSASVSGLKVNQAYMWHIRAQCTKKSWTAYSNSVQFKISASGSITFNTGGGDAPIVTEEPEGLQVRVLSNPSASYFTLVIQSSANKAVSLRMSDGVGRMVEGKNGLASNTTLYIGQNYRAGIYFAQVMQGSKVVTLKLVKQ